MTTKNNKTKAVSDGSCNISLTKTLRHSQDFIDAGLTSAAQSVQLDQVAKQFSFAMNSTMQAQQQSLSMDDPINKQFVPSELELLHDESELKDPIGDDVHSPVPGIVHRYPDRCLLKPVSVCPVYCRFCFRREKLGASQEKLSPAQLADAICYIQNNSTIWEVILTGGDPLILKPAMLKQLMTSLAAIAHVKVVRIHTRIPVVDPARITAQMIAALHHPSLTTYIVIHANHVNEFSTQAKTCIAELADAGLPLLSQSVLLKGINDSTDALTQLMRCFVENRIKPYYLHHLDKARGTQHFRTSIEKGQQLMQGLRGTVSGLCQPQYVLDVPGGFGKVPIQTQYLIPTPSPNAGICYQIHDLHSQVHDYQDIETAETD